MSVNGSLRGTVEGISRYDTLVVCLQMMENMRHMLSRGGRGVEWEAGCEPTYKVFAKHEENVREMMRKIRGWETREEQEKQEGKKDGQASYFKPVMGGHPVEMPTVQPSPALANDIMGWGRNGEGAFYDG